MPTEPKPKITGVQTENTSNRTNNVSLILTVSHFLFLIAAIILIVRIVYLYCFYEPAPDFQKSFTPVVELNITEPVRGSILTYDGKLLAASVPYFQVHMDCTVRKEEFAAEVRRGQNLIMQGQQLRDMEGKQAKKKGSEDIERGGKYVESGQAKEAEWLSKAEALSHNLAEIYGDKTAEEYFALIKNSRDAGRKYVTIGGRVTYDTLLIIRKFPLFKEGKFRGGYMEEQIDSREYPYDKLARRTIGLVSAYYEQNSLMGIEGKFNYALSGTPGKEWLCKTDGGKQIVAVDSANVKVVNGQDVRTTLNIEFQDIVDRALRQKIMENDNIEGGCAVVMEVSTGAIRAMVNLRRNEEGIPTETYNYAVGRAGDPGSVFKLVTLMTLIEDGKVKSLNEEIPTFGGHWKYDAKTTFNDEYLIRRGVSHISIIDGFKISSNNVFRYLASQNYGDNPKRYVDKLYEYKLTEAYDFDVAGMATPSLPIPETASWSGTSLPSIAIGYSVTVTPLHILTFYNAVANKGKMMKPYLVEDLERNGHVEEKRGPVILNGSICSQATADTLTRALCAVTTPGGTGAAMMKIAKCKVAGKTGTAQIPFKEGNKVVYKDRAGNRKHQATFVGFFPAENPKYTAIVVMYSKLGPQNLYGSAGVPVFSEIVNGIYALSEDWEEPLKVKK